MHARPWRTLMLGASLLTAALALAGAPAHAAPPPTVKVGACYNLNDTQVRAQSLPATDAVQCSSAHTIQITATGVVPGDQDVTTYPARACSPAQTVRTVGANIARKHIVRNPVRVYSFHFLTGTDSYACAVGVATFKGTGPYSITPVQAPMAAVVARGGDSLGLCFQASKGRDVTDPWISVPCSTKPRWQVQSWYLLYEQYATYPGAAKVRALGTSLCPRPGVWTGPSAANWDAGVQTILCYRKIT